MLERLVRVNKPSQRLLFSSFAEYAAASSGVVEAADVARNRMEELYALRTQIPAAMVHMLGWWIDCHIPAATSGCKRIVDVYRRGLEPEAQFEYPPSFYLQYVERAWIVGPGDRHSAERTAALKLLRKGASYPPRIRYIGGQFKACSDAGGEALQLAWSIVVLHELGSYPGRTKLRPPCERIPILTADPADTILAAVSKKGPKELHCLTTAFLYWAARSTSAVFAFLRRISPAFIQSAESMKLECFDKPASIVVKGALSTNVVVRTPCEMFRDVLKIGKKIPVWVQQSGISDADFDASYAAGVSETPWSRSVALGAGMSRDAVSVLARTFSNRTAVTDALDRIDQLDRARLYVYLLARETRSSVKCTQSSSVIARAQANACIRRTGKPELWALVCVSCGTWREKSKCIAGVSKATSGVVADMGTARYACNACSADWSVFKVNLVGTVLTAKVRMTTSPVCIMVCAGCGMSASPFTMVGVLPYCLQCASVSCLSVKSEAVCTVCKADIKAPLGGYRVDCLSGALRTRSSEVLCRTHFNLVKRRIPALSEEDLLCADGARCTKRAITGRVRIRRARLGWKRRKSRWDEGMAHV